MGIHVATSTWFFDKGAKNIQGHTKTYKDIQKHTRTKTASSTNVAGKTGHLHAEN
jgi:hypothetical protein